MFSKRMILVAVVIVLVAVNVILLTITGKHTQAPSGLGRGALVVVSPFQKQFTAFFQSVKNMWNEYFFLVSTAKENQQLKKALGQSMQQLNRFAVRPNWPTSGFAICWVLKKRCHGR
jgi:rod shape-determining protein MreC